MLTTIDMKKHRDIEPYRLQYFKIGKSCESDAINGAVSKFWKRYGIQTSFNDQIVDIIKKCESKEFKPHAVNI